MNQPDWKAAEAERHAAALRVLTERPQAVRAELRAEILRGKVLPGMTPYEANLAGGAFTFHVKPDETFWKPDSNPFNVMWGQTERPDDSVIRMTFRNRTQFDSPVPTVFSVQFTRGRAQEITREGP